MIRLATLLLLSTVIGCGTVSPTDPTPPADPVPLEADGLHNLFRVSDRVFSGSSPDGPDGFASLQRLGVKTVISVDGAKPDVAAADTHGMRYVHLPFGYDGIPADRVGQLAKAVRDLPGPVYIHCHHGKHRGPAACAAVQLILDPSWSVERAERWLAIAGTDPKYSGLIRLPHTLHRPTLSELDSLPTDFPTAASVEDLVRLMVQVDTRWDHLKEVKAAGWKSPARHPDLDPPHEGVILAELYREAARLQEATTKGNDFLALLAEAEAGANELSKALRAKDTAAASVAFAKSQAACSKCHEQYRDRK